MTRRLSTPWPLGTRTVFFEDVASAPTLGRAVEDGRIRKLAPKVYTADLLSSAEDVIVHNVLKVIGRRLPGAILADRTAAEGGKVVDGWLFVSTDERVSDLVLPGVTVNIRPLERFLDDVPITHGLFMTSAGRTIIDNLVVTRSRGDRPARTLSWPELQDWLARKTDAWGDRIDNVREQAIALARARDPALVAKVDQLFDEVAGRRPMRPDAGSYARDRARGETWDEQRILMFEAAADRLRRLTSDVPAYLPEPDPPGELPFYESYFSNYIEGTEFAIEDARRIVTTGEVPDTRPEDGHDILGTFHCIVGPSNYRTSPDPDELLTLLCDRHRTLLSARPEKRPGNFKQQNNRVGSLEFVDWKQTEGTLRRGLAMVERVPVGFARAVFVMFVVAEVHPFEDGNGRAARLMMNAELSAVDQCRIIVPTVIRNEYISGLRRASRNNGDISAVVRVITHAWRWTVSVPWDQPSAADAYMVASNATMDSTDAEQQRKHLDIF